MEKPVRLGKRAREVLEGAVRRKRLRDSLRVISALNRSGLEYVVLKGPALSYYLPERDFGDLDILVAREDAEKACNILAGELGYGFEHPEELVMLGERGRSNTHDISMRSDGLIPVEVHYRMFNYVPDQGIEPFSGKMAVELGGVRIPCQSAEHQLMESLFHNVYHHMLLCDRQRWIEDLNAVIGGNEVDWDRFARLLERTGQSELASLTVRFLESTGKTPIRFPPGFDRRLRPESPLGYLRMRTFGWALRFIWDRLFPPEHILRKRFGFRKGSPLVLLSYPANWARLAVEAARSVIPSRRGG